MQELSNNIPTTIQQISTDFPQFYVV